MEGDQNPAGVLPAAAACVPQETPGGAPAPTLPSNVGVSPGPGPRAKLPPGVLQAASLFEAPTGRVSRARVQPGPAGLGRPGEGHLIQMAPSFRGSCGGPAPPAPSDSLLTGRAPPGAPP